MASKYDTAWQEYSSIIEKGEGQEFFDVAYETEQDEPAPPAVAASEPSKYDVAFDEFQSGESETPTSELLPALQTTVQRTKGMGGSGLELLAKNLQEGAAKRKAQVAEQLKDIPEEDRIPDWPWPAETPHRPLEGMERFGKSLQESAQKEMDKLPRAPEFVRTGDWWENLKNSETRGAQLKWMLGSNIGPTIAIGASALIAGAVGGPTSAASVGMGGAYLLEAGGSYKDLKQMGVPEEEARDTAAIVGTINAALELAPLAHLASKIPGIRKLIGAGVEKELVKKPVYRRVLSGALSQGALESATETLQEIVSNTAKKIYDENQDILHGTGEAAFVGGIFGALFGGSAGIIPQGQAPTPEGDTGPAVKPGIEPGTDRPSIFKDQAIEAQGKVQEAAEKAGIKPSRQDQIQDDISSDKMEIDLQFSDADRTPPVSGATQDRRSILKQESDRQVNALEEDLNADRIGLPTYPVEELPADTPIPAQVEELPIAERITGTEAVPPDAPPKIPRYDVAGLVASPEIVAQPVEEITGEAESVTGVTERPEKDTELVRDAPIQEQQPSPIGSDEVFDEFIKTEAEKKKGQEAAAPAPEIPDQVSDIDVAATQARPDEASEPQIEAGTYKKGHIKMGGLDVSIEHEAGSKRQPEWPTLTGHYGYVRGTESKDGDQVDVFIKPGTDQATVGDTQVFVVDQTNIDEDFTFDEHKVMVGYGSVEEARQGYLSNYSKGWQGLGAITESSFSDFKEWLNTGNTKRPFAKQQQKVWSGQPTVPATTKAEETTEVQQLKRAKLTYEQWKESYSNTFKALQKYTPNQAGFGVHTSAMADLEDAYPGFAKRHDKELENEQQTTARPAETHSKAVDMEKIVAASGPIKAYIEARGFKWPMGPNSKRYKQLKAEYTAAREKYERDTMEVKPPAGVTPAEIPRERPAKPKGHRPIGKNADGENVYEDENGVRYVIDGNIRISQKVFLVPTRSGMQFVPEVEGRFEIAKEPVAKPAAEDSLRVAPTPEPLTVQEIMAATRNRMPEGYVISVELIDEKNTLTVKGPGLEEKGIGYNKAGIEEAIRLANVHAKKAAPTTATAEPRKTSKLDLIKMPPETVEVEGTGETVTIEESAAAAIDRVDGKLMSLYRLRECLRA